MPEPMATTCPDCGMYPCRECWPDLYSHPSDTSEDDEGNGSKEAT